MEKKKFVLVSSEILPQVYLRVLHAKELLASGKAHNISQAIQLAQVSRSAYYKYKAHLFYSDAPGQTVTITAKLLDEPGALQAMLTGLSSAGADILTINQSIPESGAAMVAVTLRTRGLTVSPEELLSNLAQQPTVVLVEVSHPTGSL